MRKTIVRLALLCTFAAALAACQTGNTIGARGPAPPLPTDGPIIYSCANGTQLSVTFANNQAQVAVVGGYSMVLPGSGAGTYTNGRYTLTGGGADTTWAVGRSAPVTCHGG